jgi:predicted  nucleic acid-binding Zn-ribbon protein
MESTVTLPQRNRRRSSGVNPPPAVDATTASSGAVVADEDYNALLVSFYTRAYPSAEDFASDAADLDLHEISEAVTELATEVAALREETEVLGAHVQTLQQRRTDGASGSSGAALDSSADVGAGTLQNDVSANIVTIVGGDGGSNNNGTNPTASAAYRAGNLNSRRGRSYRRRSLGALDLFMRVEDKAALLRQEMTRLRSQEERITKEADSVQEALVATVEEAIRRQQELQLELLQFNREVAGNVDDGGVNAEGSSAAAAAAATPSTHRRNPFHETTELTASAAAAATTADELLRYLERRHATQVNYLDKLEMQCQAVEQDIARAQQLVRQRRIAGEAFQAVDLEQLRIEHKQLTERMAAKNNELAELKGTSTRTVQQLNQLMGQLNELASEQTRLKRESKSRTEYLSRCDKEYATATAEAVQAESKHDVLRAQQEAIKAPKIEEYMAQKAEEVELEKAVRNWERKVQIAEGQAAVVRQRVKRMTSQRTAAVKYAAEKRQLHQQQQQQQQQTSIAASSKPVVGGTRSLLQQRRQQQQQQQELQAKCVTRAATNGTAPAVAAGATKVAAPAEPSDM